MRVIVRLLCVENVVENVPTARAALVAVEDQPRSVGGIVCAVYRQRLPVAE